MAPIWTCHLKAIQADSNNPTTAVYRVLSGNVLFDVALMVSIERAAVIYYFQRHKTVGLPNISIDQPPVSMLAIFAEGMTGPMPTF
jgi:hypothetical protein